VHDGDLAHVVVHSKGPGCLKDVLAGFHGVTKGLEIQPEIQVGIAQLVASGFVLALFGGRQYCSWLALPGIEFEDLLHGHAWVFADWEKLAAGGPDALEPGDAQKVPGWVLDVVRVHGLVQLELFLAVSVALRVVQRQPPLPQVRLRRRHGHDELIEDAG